jgi:8-oxo-dGTP diphosphatase
MKQAVIGIVFSKDRTEVLCVKRRDVPVWVLPGGGVDAFEEPAAAVIREVQEETGFSSTIKRKVGQYSPINRLSQYTEVYECVPISGKIDRGDESLDVKFCAVDDLPEPFFVVHEAWLKDALKNYPEPIQRPISEVTYGNLLMHFIKHPSWVFRLACSRLGIPINSKK